MASLMQLSVMAHIDNRNTTPPQPAAVPSPQGFPIPPPGYHPYPYYYGAAHPPLGFQAHPRARAHPPPVSASAGHWPLHAGSAHHGYATPPSAYLPPVNAYAMPQPVPSSPAVADGTTSSPVSPAVASALDPALGEHDLTFHSPPASSIPSSMQSGSSPPPTPTIEAPMPAHNEPSNLDHGLKATDSPTHPFPQPTSPPPHPLALYTLSMEGKPSIEALLRELLHAEGQIEDLKHANSVLLEQVDWLHQDRNAMCLRIDKIEKGSQCFLAESDGEDGYDSDGEESGAEEGVSQEVTISKATAKHRLINVSPAPDEKCHPAHQLSEPRCCSFSAVPGHAKLV
jgi:hypothetical protein